MTPASIRPFDARMISVGDGHWLYVEEVGSRGGIPALFLHGGPGSGAQHSHRELFDPDRHHAILFDQRSAGRSHPFLSLEANTTAHLVADIELIRQHFGFDRWLVVGGSWGSTLALAYAQSYPHRVRGLVLRAIFLGTRREVEWAFIQGPQWFRPDLYDDWISHLSPGERSNPLTAYLERLMSSDEAVKRKAAHLWHTYERALSELIPATIRIPAKVEVTQRMPPTPIIEAHYIRHDFFLEPGQLQNNMSRLHGIPGALIQGRYDLLCPPEAAFAIAKAWPDCQLHIMDAAGHAMTEQGVVIAMKRAIAAMA